MKQRRLCLWCSCAARRSAVERGDDRGVEQWTSHCMSGLSSGRSRRRVQSSRRAGVGAAHWRRRPGRGPKPYVHCVFYVPSLFVLSQNIWATPEDLTVRSAQNMRP
eukprot:2930354-Prymnesium_polylepis.1